MHRCCERLDSIRDDTERHPKTPAVRTYRQIATVLAKHDGISMTPAHVARICRAAEVKFANALLGDRVTCEGLRSRAGQVEIDDRLLSV